jgi:hypothetical protein
LENVRLEGTTAAGTKYGLTIEEDCYTCSIVNPQIGGEFSAGIYLKATTLKPNGLSIHGGWVKCSDYADSVGILQDCAAFGMGVWGTYFEQFKLHGIWIKQGYANHLYPAVIEGSTATNGIKLGDTAGGTGSNNNLISIRLCTGVTNGIEIEDGSRNRVYIGSVTYTGKVALIDSGADYNALYTYNASDVQDDDGNNLVMADLGSNFRIAQSCFVMDGKRTTMTGHETFTAKDGNVFSKDPNGDRNFNPTGTFVAYHMVILINRAGGAETITFDATVGGLNQAVAQNQRGIFIYDGSSWVKVFVG